MEAEVVCPLFPVKGESSEPAVDLDSVLIKNEPLDDTDLDDLVNSSRTESVCFDNSELSVEKPTHGIQKPSKIMTRVSVSDQLFPINNKFMESAELDPLYINPELIKRERINDGDDDFSTGSYALPIDTLIQRNAFMTKKSTKKNISNNGQVGKKHFSQATTVSNKSQRKDKGASRVTSYLLWSMEIRQKLMSTEPDLDFSSISRKLGKMWANLKTNERYNWKRRARRINSKNNISRKKSTNNQTSSLGFNDERLQEHGAGGKINEYGIPFCDINHEAGFFSEYNAEFHSTESTNYPMEQWSITEIPEVPSRSSMRKKSLKERNPYC